MMKKLIGSSSVVLNQYTTTFKPATTRKLKYYLVVSLGIHTIISGLATSSVVSDCSEENKRCELKTSIIRQSD